MENSNNLVAVVSLCEGKHPAKIIGETKNYYRVSLKHLPKGHSARYSDKGPIDIQMYSKKTGIKKGAGNPQSMRYCPDYIMNLDKAIESLERDIEECKQAGNFENYLKDVEKELAECKKAKIEGIPA